MARSKTSAVDPGVAVELWHGALTQHRLKQSDHIAQAAMGIIASEGIAGLSMSSIAEAAGVSRQTLYKYFPDVDAVLLGLASMASDTDAQLTQSIESEPDPSVGLRLFVAMVLEAASAGHPSPVVLASALPPATRVSLQDHALRAETLVIDLVRRGIRSKAFRADLDPELDGRIVYRAILGAHDLAAEDGVDIERLAEHVATDVLRMVETTAASAGR